MCSTQDQTIRFAPQEPAYKKFVSQDDSTGSSISNKLATQNAHLYHKQVTCKVTADLKVKQMISFGAETNQLDNKNIDNITNNTSSYHHSNSEYTSTSQDAPTDQASSPGKQRKTSGQEIDLFSEMTLTSKSSSSTSKYEQLMKLQQLREENERLDSEKQCFYGQIQNLKFCLTILHGHGLEQKKQLKAQRSKLIEEKNELRKVLAIEQEFTKKAGNVAAYWSEFVEDYDQFTAHAMPTTACPPQNTAYKIFSQAKSDQEIQSSGMTSYCDMDRGDDMDRKLHEEIRDEEREEEEFRGGCTKACGQDLIDTKHAVADDVAANAGI